MATSTDIKFYVHTNNNAPQLQNAYGSMINVLDACLINGINIGTVSSLTASGTTVTALFSSSHNLMQYQVIKITGASQPEFNGEHRILTVPNATTVTFELVAVPSVATATGAISCSLPALGWEKPFGNTGGKAAYRSKNLLLPSRPFLRVVDELDPVYTATYAKYAKVGIVEDMTDIDTMLGVQAPYDIANPDKNWVGSGGGASVINGWAKWYYARAYSLDGSGGDNAPPIGGSRVWVLIGNDEYFYILPGNSPLGVNVFKLLYGFGVFKTLIENDNSNTFLISSYSLDTANNYISPSTRNGATSNTSNKFLLLQRSHAQDGKSVEAKCYSIGCAASVISGRSDYIGSANLNGLSPFAPVYIQENVLRGVLPSLNWLFQNKPFINNQPIENNNSIYVAQDIIAEQQQGQVVFYLGDL